MSSLNCRVSTVTGDVQNTGTDTNVYLLKLQEEISQTIEKIHNSIQSKTVFRSDIQEEIAKQMTVLQRFEGYIIKKYNKLCKNQVECSNLKSKFQYFQLAFDALLLNPTEIVIAKNIRYQLEYFLNSKEFLGCIKSFFKRTTRESLTPTKVLLGLVMAIPIYGIGIPFFLTTATILTTIPNIIEYGGNELMIRASNTPTLLNVEQRVEAQKLAEKKRREQGDKFINKLINLSENSSLVIMVASAGAFGSIVSIFIRLDQYKDTEYKSSAAPILVGFAKPLIGTAFGILIFAMINSNIISFPILQVSTNSTSNSTSINIENNTVNAKYFLFFTLAFVVGFSERLANDIIKRVEVGLSGQEFTDKLDKTGQKVTNKIEQAEQEIEEKIEVTGQEIKEEIRRTSEDV